MKNEKWEEMRERFRFDKTGVVIVPKRTFDELIDAAIGERDAEKCDGANMKDATPELSAMSVEHLELKRSLAMANEHCEKLTRQNEDLRGEYRQTRRRGQLARELRKIRERSDHREFLLTAGGWNLSMTMEDFDWLVNMAEAATE